MPHNPRSSWRARVSWAATDGHRKPDLHCWRTTEHSCKPDDMDSTSTRSGTAHFDAGDGSNRSRQSRHRCLSVHVAKVDIDSRKGHACIAKIGFPKLRSLCSHRYRL